MTLIDKISSHKECKDLIDYMSFYPRLLALSERTVPIKQLMESAFKRDEMIFLDINEKSIDSILKEITNILRLYSDFDFLSYLSELKKED